MIRQNNRAIVVLVLGFGVFACEADGGADPATNSTTLTGKADHAGISAQMNNWEEIANRCTKPTENEPNIYSDDYIWSYTPESMEERFAQMYDSEKRLFERAYYDEHTDQFLLPSTDSWGGAVALPKRLVENVRLHIEKALVRGYAEYVFFPDMGHSHLFIPQARWDEEYAGTPAPELSAMYSRLFDDPELLVLYHTAEQLQMLDQNDELLDNRHLRWRFFTRNPVGDNAYLSQMDVLHEPTHKANTCRNIPGYHYHGAGFNISANKRGCFPYVIDGITRWFDISFSDPPPNSTNGEVYF